MKKLLGYILLSAASLAATLALLWAIPGTHPHDLAAIVNKKAMLAEKPSPRIIFVGGSSQLTLDTPLIERELGYHAINMSLWGGMGTRGHLDEVGPLLKPGDVVVITIEYGAILDHEYARYINTNDEAKKFFFLASPGRHLRKYLEQGRALEAFSIIHELAQLKMKSYIRNLFLMNVSHMFDTGFPNYPAEFNRNGDRIRPYVVVRPLGNRNTSFGYPDWNDLSYLNSFHDYAARRNARVLFYFSHFPRKQYDENIHYIEAYRNLMASQSKIPLLNTPAEFVYPDEFFADTIYHLNEKGERVRSAALLAMLRKML